MPVKRRLAGYFTELRWNRDRRLLVTGGVRLDDIDREPLPGAASEDDRVISVNPRLAVAWLARPEASSATTGYQGSNYMHDGNTAKGTKSFAFKPTVPATGSRPTAPSPVSSWVSTRPTRSAVS